MRTAVLALIILSGCNSAKDQRIAELEKQVAELKGQAPSLGAAKPVKPVGPSDQVEAAIARLVAADSPQQIDRLAALQAAFIEQAGDMEIGAQNLRQVLVVMHDRALDFQRTLGHDILDSRGRLDDPASTLLAIRERTKRNLGKRALPALRNLFGNEAGTLAFNANIPAVAASLTKH